MADKIAEAWDLEDMLPPKEGSLECHERGCKGPIRQGLGGREEDGHVGQHVERDGLPECALPPKKGCNCLRCFPFSCRLAEDNCLLPPAPNAAATGGTLSNQVRRDCWEF